MRVTLSSDHRTVDGAYAARFLADVRTCLENPVSLLV
jgi:pyruvate dehydrogenase E2 component (dihydrolipoamide acetyltransferase)